MKYKNELLRLTVLIVMLMGISNNLLAQTKFAVNDIYYETQNENTVYVAPKPGFFQFYTLEDVVIPETVTDPNTGITYTVTGIKTQAFLNDQNLKSIELPNTITVIDSMAFSNNKKLENITIPVSVTKISKIAFGNCTQLTTVTFEGLPTLANDAFSNCTAITDIYVPCPYKDVFVEMFTGMAGSDETSKHRYDDKFRTENVDLASTITDNEYIADCDCYNIPETITIMDNASLSFKDYTAAKTALSGKTIVLEKNLPIGKWSLIGNLTSTSTYEFLDANYGDVNTTSHHAFAANAYDYTINAWYEKYQRHDDATPANYGAFFAYPFVNELGIGTELTDDNYAILTQTIPTANIDQTVTFTASNTADESAKEEFGGRWFALSNPYIGRLNAKEFYNRNSSEIQGSYIYVYDNAAGDWKNVNISEDIALMPATGFMVASAGDAQNLSVKFTTSQIMTTETPTATYKSDKQQPIAFTVTANGVEKQMFAKISETSQDGFDGEDSYVMVSENNDAITPYFVVDNRSIIDNHFRNLPYTCDVNFNSYHGATAELSVKNIPDGVEVSIIDSQNDNQQTILTEENNFVFYADEGTNKGRYKVMFAKKNAGIEDMATANNGVEITNRNNEITIHGSDLRNAEIINALGQTVYSQKLSGSDATVKFNGTSGAYIVKIQTAKGTKSGKIIVK
ncbi:MAG: leucine-rich repeat domain-containing protein [Bacteroidales bacterium]|nr:leucine-rich repeat domain-containing protein [Bacteroidales bacterium]